MKLSTVKTATINSRQTIERIKLKHARRPDVQRDKYKYNEGKRMEKKVGGKLICVNAALKEIQKSHEINFS